MISPPASAPPPVEPEITPGEQQVGRRVLVNTGALAGSSLWRIAISFVLQVFIARQLDIPGVGIYNAALAYLNVGQVISEIGLPSLLVRNLAQHPQQRRALYFMSLRLQVGMALVVWAGLAAFALLLEPTSRLALWIVGASLPFYAVTSTTQTIFRAAERMELIMGVEWVINAVILGMSLAVLFAGGDILALVGVLVAAQALSAAICAGLLQRSGLLQGPQTHAPLVLGELWGQAMPFFRLSIADVLLQRLDILLLTLLGGEVVTGIYSLAYNLVRVLTKLVQSFWQALYPTFSRLYHHRDRKYAVLAQLGLRYGLIALLPAAALSAAVAPDLLPFIFSTDYQESASVYRILVWQAPLLFIASYASTLLMVQRHPKASLVIASAHIVTLLILLPLLTRWAEADGAAWASLIAGAMGTLAGLALIRRHRVPLAFAIEGAPGGLLLLVAAVLVGLFTTRLLPLPWLPAAAAGGLLYLALIWRLGVFSPQDIQQFRRALRQPESAPPPE
ncbi:MAG: oligosaccharide flippase family protein [Litorilinea sp.]